jgi:hypothetical protein
VNIAATVIDEAVAAGLLLSRHGDRIHVDSPLGQPLPEDLKLRITSHRAELLAWLEWCERADAQLLDCSRRLECSYPAGCPIDDAEWRATEERLHAAYRSQDPGLWREGLEDYERLALERFRAYERESR